MTNKKQIIVMMGGPGVGKGTLSKMLLNLRPYKHIEAGAILRGSAHGCPAQPDLQ